jgi:hypothetical protein
VGYDQPPTVQAVDHSLRQVRFEPRPSLEAELLWRLRRGAEDRVEQRESAAGGLLVLAAGLIGLLLFLFWVKLLSLAPGPG